LIKVGIYGGSGYMRGEAVRILLEHPEAKIAWITYRGDKAIESFHRNFCGQGLTFIKPEETTPCDMIFAALLSG
jgi:N-acetyl-gamma-glutamylphosphate reductase